jgi:hypothetical protein
MINWGLLLSRIVGALMSWAQAANLRNRMFKMAEESEIMMTALEDIARMDKDGKMGNYAQRAIDIVKKLE